VHGFFAVKTAKSVLKYLSLDPGSFPNYSDMPYPDQNGSSQF